MVGEMRFLG